VSGSALGLVLGRLLGVGVDLRAGNAVGGEEVEEVRFGEGEAQCTQGDAEFVVVEVAVAVEVEEGELGRVVFSSVFR
jgi:hypothetical protein